MHEQRNLTSWPIRRKLQLLTLLVFLPAAGIIVASGLRQRIREIADAKGNAMLLVQSLAAQQEQLANATKQMLITLAHSPEVERLSADACCELFREIHRQYPFYSIIAAVTPQGVVFASSIPFEPGSVCISEQKHVKDAISSGDFSSGEYVVGKITQIRSIHYSYPVFDAQKKLVAVVVAGFNLNSYSHFIKNAGLPKGSAVVIHDHKGLRLFRMPENSATPLGKAPNFGMEQIEGRNEGTYERTGDDGIYRIYAFKRVSLKEGSPPYLLIDVGIPKDPFVRQANAEMLRNLLMLGAAAFVTMSLAWFFANFALVKPIDRLVSVTKQLGSGNPSARTYLPHSSDELGHLAKSFDEMASLLEARIAERKSAEEALRKSEERFRSLAESSEDCIIRYDSGCRTLYVNPACARISGIEADELTGKTHRELGYDEALCGELEKRIKYVFETGRPQQWEFHFDSTRGRVYMDWRVVPELKDGKVEAVLGISRDITERRKAEEVLSNAYAVLELRVRERTAELSAVNTALISEIARRKQMEEELIKAKKLEATGILAEGIAHDFNNLLTIMLGSIDMAKKHLTPESSALRLLGNAEEAILRAIDLTNKFITFSAGEAPCKRPTPIQDLVRASSALAIADCNMECRYFFPDDLRLTEIDKGQISQVIYNLVTNAREAMSQEGTIDIRAENVEIGPAQSGLPLKAGRYIKIAIKDCGIGICDSDLPKIFDPYFSTKSRCSQKGMGMGLTIAHSIVVKHGGCITVESEVGKGTTVSVFLPALEAAFANS